MTYRFDRFGPSDSVLVAAELRRAAEAADGRPAAVDAVLRHLTSCFVDADGKVVWAEIEVARP